MNYTQHRIISGLILTISLWVVWISFTGKPVEAYFFPRIIAVIFATLAGATFIKALLKRTTSGKGIDLQTLKRITPGLIITSVYVLWAAKNVGFYTATALAFFILLSFYDPSPHGLLKTWVKRVAITAGFILVIYTLFAVVLNVYTPRGHFI